MRTVLDVVSQLETHEITVACLEVCLKTYLELQNITGITAIQQGLYDMLTDESIASRDQHALGIRVWRHGLVRFRKLSAIQ